MKNTIIPAPAASEARHTHGMHLRSWPAAASLRRKNADKPHSGNNKVKQKNHELQNRTGGPAVRLRLLSNLHWLVLCLRFCWNKAIPLARARKQERRSAIRGWRNSRGQSVHGSALEAISMRAEVLCVPLLLCDGCRMVPRVCEGNIPLRFFQSKREHQL